MTRTRYRLTPLGWLGAVLFVAPTPIAGGLVLSAVRRAPGAYEAALAATTGDLKYLAQPVPDPFVMIALATATMIGLVLLIVGREIVTRDD